MDFELWYVMSVVISACLVLGLDLTKPSVCMCTTYAREERRRMRIRTAIITPFLAYGAGMSTAVLLKQYAGFSTESSLWSGLFVGPVCVTFLIWATRATGLRFQRYIWIATG
jgi:hypothetical protein